MQYLLISAMALTVTLYDYLLLFDDEVGRGGLNICPSIEVLTHPF